MIVAELMTKDVKTCSPDATLREAAGIMWENDCGCVPVVDDEGGLVGIITDRDICMAAYTQGRRLDEIAVHGPMSTDPRTCRPDDGHQIAEACMQESKVRRLPVVDDAGQLAGIISLNDVALAATNARGKSRRAGVSDAEIRETLAGICERDSVEAAS